MKSFKYALAAGLALAVGVVWLATNVSAAPITKLDSYIGGDPTNSGWDGQDIIGTPSVFSVESATFGIVGGTDLQVRINTEYAGERGTLNTDYGALFIGTDITKYVINDGTTDINGDPVPAANTVNDTYRANPERFDLGYVMVGADDTQFSGDLAVYSLDGTGNDVEGSTRNAFAPGNPGGAVYRAEQAWKPKDDATYDPVASGAGVGSWSIVSDDYVQFVIKDFWGTIDAPGGTSIAGTQVVFGWAMSCANDIIVDVVQFSGDIGEIPLPPGLILLLSGLMGLGWLGRARMRSGSA